MRILVVEDERKVARFIRKGLGEQGFVVELCPRGDEALGRILEGSCDAVVLDVMLPGRDGLSVLRELRARQVATPVILLTARGGLDERVEGLNLGADDYLAKPFFMEELVARIHAVVRRGGPAQGACLRVGTLTLDRMAREARRGSRAIELTPREFNLLELLMRSPGRVFTRTHMLEHVWGYDFDPQTNVVDVYVRRVRSKIDEPDQPSPIEAVRGVGYRFRKEDAPA